MKTFFLIVAGFLYPFVMNGTKDAYLQKMQQTIGQMNQSTTIEQYQQVANTFERISAAEADQWQPMYYTAYCYVMMSFQVNDGSRRDEILDQAQVWIDKAFKVAPDESELFVLQAFLYPSRIIVNPIDRGMKYMDLTFKALAKSKELNVNNPRAYYLEAVMIQNSPEAMGGGAVKALPVFETALEKFQQFKPNTIIDPDWGEEAARQSYSALNNSIDE